MGSLGAWSLCLVLALTGMVHGNTDQENLQDIGEFISDRDAIYDRFDSSEPSEHHNNFESSEHIEIQDHFDHFEPLEHQDHFDPSESLEHEDHLHSFEQDHFDPDSNIDELDEVLDSPLELQSTFDSDASEELVEVRIREHNDLDEMEEMGNRKERRKGGKISKTKFAKNKNEVKKGKGNSNSIRKIQRKPKLTKKERTEKNNKANSRKVRKPRRKSKISNKKDETQKTPQKSNRKDKTQKKSRKVNAQKKPKKGKAQKKPKKGKAQKKPKKSKKKYKAQYKPKKAKTQKKSIFSNKKKAKKSNKKKSGSKSSKNIRKSPKPRKMKIKSKAAKKGKNLKGKPRKRKNKPRKTGNKSRSKGFNSLDRNNKGNKERKANSRKASKKVKDPKRKSKKPKNKKKPKKKTAGKPKITKKKRGCPGKCVTTDEGCPGRFLKGASSCSKGRCCVQGKAVRQGVETKLKCQALNSCTTLGGKCRKSRRGCRRKETQVTNTQGNYCTSSDCVCCYKEGDTPGSCNIKDKCSNKGGVCQGDDVSCVGKFKFGRRWCSSAACGCCIPGKCKNKFRCTDLGGTCVKSKDACSTGVVLTEKRYCSGKGCYGCCVPDPVTPAPITPAPKTPAPNTKAPTTKAPTTKAPTTKAPTTKAPTTKAPTTKAPTTKAPTTKAPTTKAPSTKVPTTKAPTTKAPTTKAPTTKAPTTKAPITKAPTTKAPTTKAPTTKAPTTAPATTTTSKCPRPYCDPCGVAPINVASSRIVGGVDASPGEFPYQVFIVTTIAGSSYSCGGSIIKKKWILTAAHCFFDQQNVKASSVAVFLGSHKRDSATEVPVTKFITHETYDPANGAEEEDIALIELKNDLVFDANISPICLAEETDIIAGGKSIVTGWGDLKFGSTDPTPNTLQEVALDVISVTECGTKIGLPTDTKKVVCTLTPDKDSCQGDSGGPLVVKLCDGRYAQIGIVSYGDGCAKPNSPGVYANVPNYLTWINTNTGSTTC